MLQTRVLRAAAKARPLREDPWVTLGVTRQATTKEIKKAYLKKARKVHPDITGDGSTADDFVRLRDAYNELLTARRTPAPGSRSTYKEAKAAAEKEKAAREERAARERPTFGEAFRRSIRTFQDDVRSIPSLFRRWVRWEMSCLHTLVQHLIFWPSVAAVFYLFLLLVEVTTHSAAIKVTPHRDRFHRFMNEPVNERNEAFFVRDAAITQKMYEDLAERDDEDEALLHAALEVARAQERRRAAALAATAAAVPA